MHSLALIAHDDKKRDMIALVQRRLGDFAREALVATQTTGTHIERETGLPVTKMLSGPLGGDLQIGALIATGQVKAVIFLRDPLTAHPHEPDISALLKVCDTHNIPLATNLATADLILDHLAEGHPTPSGYTKRMSKNDLYDTIDLQDINPQDWKTVAPHFAALGNEDLTAEGVGDWLLRWSELEKNLSESGARASRAKSEDTTDAAAEAAYLHFVQEIIPQWMVAAQALKTKLLAVPGYEPAPEHKQFLRRLRSDADLFQAANVPLQAELQTLANEYDKFTGPMTVTLGGEEVTLPQAEGKMLDPDRSVRESAWRAVQARWLEARKPLDELYLKMLPLRRQLAKNAGLTDYRAYMWQAMKRFDYTPEDSLAFGQAIEAEVVPLAKRLLESRRQNLGVETLRPWDLATDPANRAPLRPFADVAELEEGTARIFANVDPDLGADFEKFRRGYLDLGSRKGKAPGGYCSFFPKTGLPYIFMNAVGTEGDVRTMLHEGGHAFHGLASSATQPLLWNRGAPMEFNEVASMAMELLALPYLEKDKGGFYTPEEAHRARQEQLERIVMFLPYMAVVDGFQHWVYSEAPENVTARDMDAQWNALWTRFMGGTDWSGLDAERATGWHRKLHIFTVPFYYVEYGLAQLGALQVWRNALTDQADAVRRYRSALALGNTRPLPDLYTEAGARLAFDRETVGELARLVESHLEG